MPNRVERHIFVGRKDLEDLCYKSALLYNAANYEMRQSFINTGKIPGAYDLINKFTKEDQSDYRMLMAQTAQQVIILLNKNWKSFFKARQEYKKCPEKFTGRPKLPKYKKDKKQNIVIFTNQQTFIKDGYLYFPTMVNINPIQTKVIQENFQQVRIAPQATCHVIEIIYKAVAVQEDVYQENILSIDLGVNNFATCVSNIGEQPFIVNGRPIKSMNQFFNKKKAQFQSYISNSPNAISNRIRRLIHKRNCKINDYCHKTSHLIVDYCIEYRIGRIIIGKNDGWKRSVDHGKVNNQNFVQIPFDKLIKQIVYKAESVGIKVDITEESYTSKIDHFAFEEMCHQKKYKGKRVKRGLFQSSTGRYVNADVNGAIGSGRKVTGDDFVKDLLSRGVVLTPIKVAIL